MPLETNRKDHLFQTIILLQIILLVGLILASGQGAPVPSLSTHGTTVTSEVNPPASTATPPRPPTPSSTPTPTSAIAINAQSLRGTSVELWHPLSGEAGKALDGLIAQFNSQNEWGITAQGIYQGNYDSLFEKASSALQTESQPDILLVYPYQALTLKAKGAQVIPLDAYLHDPVWGMKPNEWADFVPAFLAGEPNSQLQTGLPAMRSAQLIYYNSSWARALGFSSPPSTPEQFKEQACAAASANRKDADAKNDGTGGWMISYDYHSFLGWMKAFGAEVIRPDGQGYQFNTPEVADALTFLRDLYDNGCAWLDEQSNIEEEFVARKGLFAPGSLADIPRQENIFADMTSQDEWTVIPFPSPVGKPAIVVYGPSFFILKSTPEEELAGWLLLKWLSQPESQSALTRSSFNFPVRISSLDDVAEIKGRYPQWATAAELLRYASPEPGFQSWVNVRWALSDAATQLFRYYFTIDQVPSLARLLDETANELNEASP